MMQQEHRYEQGIIDSLNKDIWFTEETDARLETDMIFFHDVWEIRKNRHQHRNQQSG